MKYPLAHKVIITGRPIRLDTTNVAETIARERKRLAAAEVCKVVKAPALVVDIVGAAPTGRHIITLPRKYIRK